MRALIGVMGLLVLGTLPVLAAPFAYIPNTKSNTVSVIDTATNTVTATVTVGDAPFAFRQFIGPKILQRSN